MQLGRGYATSAVIWHYKHGFFSLIGLIQLRNWALFLTFTLQLIKSRQNGI